MNEFSTAKREPQTQTAETAETNETLKVNETGEPEEKPLRYIVQNLESTFGVPTLKAKSEPLEMLIRIVLSQATTDILSAKTYAALKDKYKNWNKVLKADVEEIAATIKLGGLANQKANVIKSLLEQVKLERGKLNLDFLTETPTIEAVNYLKKFRGIGPKTIACTLLFACHKDIFPLDTHIFRVLRRVGLIPEKSSDERAHAILTAIVPNGKFYSLHVNLIRLGKAICRPQNPKCERCPIIDYCDYGQNQV